MNLLFIDIEVIDHLKDVKEILQDPAGDFEIRTAGLSTAKLLPVTRELLEWADEIYVLGQTNVDKLKNQWPVIYSEKKVIDLNIETEVNDWAGRD